VVEDEGVGIPAADMAHVFDPFFTMKQDIGCVGLGLYVARRILAAMLWTTSASNAIRNLI